MRPSYAGMGRMPASHFNALPKSRLGWITVAIASIYIAWIAIMARVSLGMPTWLDFTLALAPGAAATVLVGYVIARSKEHSWLLWLAALGVVLMFGSWIAFLILAL